MPTIKENIQKDEVSQAVLIADNFNEEFEPFTAETPLVLLHLVNKPIINYTLEFLALGGIKETYIFCSSHGDKIKEHIKKEIIDKSAWTQTMITQVLVSESCGSLGDCLRDLDAKGLIRGNFVLAEAGVVGNLKLLPLLKKHNETLKYNKSAAMTLIFQETGLNQYGCCPEEEFIVSINEKSRVLTHNYLKSTKNKKIVFPLDIFLENNSVSIRHNLRDTHIAICSPTLLPLFSDNFDYQLRSDFVRSVLMIDEVMESTIYCHVLSQEEHGAAITNWRMYQAISRDLVNNWFYPLTVEKSSGAYGRGVIVGKNCHISNSTRLKRCVIGDNVKILDNSVLEECYIFSNTTIGSSCTLSHCIIGSDCIIKNDSQISESIFGNDVHTNPKLQVTKAMMHSKKPIDDLKTEKLSENAYKLSVNENNDEGNEELNRILSQLRIYEASSATSDCSDSSDTTTDSEDEMSYTQSPVPDDTNMFFNEVIDSLVRGFDDKLQCDNLILEINSSRYAYNVSLKEVNYHVSKAVLNLPFQQQSGAQYMQALSRSLAYFSPILKNYIRNDDAMSDCLQAIEDVAISNNEMNESVAKVLHWFYEKDHLSEDAILLWFKKLDESTGVHKRAAPFIKWLQSAEEASSSEED